MAHHEDWIDRISGDPWKNVIMLECQKLVDESWLLPSSDWLFQVEPGTLPDKLGDTCLAHEMLQGQSVLARSWLVWQAGRLFVVGPTKNAFHRLSALRKMNPENLRHLHIVLLNWDWSHRDGLAELLDKLAPPATTVTVWTSYWIWEETLRGLGKRLAGRLRRSLKFFDPSKKNASHPGGCVGVMFDRKVTWSLTSGVSLSMSYSVARQPCLRAEFRCNGEIFVIDPVMDWLKTDRQKLQQLFLSVISDTKRRESEEYRDEILTRHLEVLETYPDCDLHHNRRSLIRAGERDKSGLDPVDLGLQKRFVLNKEAKKCPPRGQPSVRPELATVVILCGGLMKRGDREFVDPAEGVDIAILDELGQERIRTERMPILEWRLHQINSQWAQKARDRKLVVILLTTPDTEDVVDGCVAKYFNRAMLFSDADGLEIMQLPVQLIPWVTDKNGAVRAVTRDGGWQLAPRGHMDALRILLDRAREQQRTQSGTPNAAHQRQRHASSQHFALIFACNNLGNLITEETWKRLKTFAKSGATLAVELFRYRSGYDDDDRWSQLSYCSNGAPKSPVLCKRSYDTSPPVAGDTLDYSSLTWYVNVSELLKANEAADLFLGLGLVEHASDGEENKRFLSGQDIDQITHSGEVTVLGFHAVPKGDSNATSPYWHERYLGVRTKDHLRQKEFGEAFRKIATLQVRSSESLPDRPPLLVSWPKHQQYVWGGHEIATLKGLPSLYREMQIAETWEISTHELGQSQVMLNTNRKVSLRDHFGKDLDFMAKYLDCHEPLSVQVHPDAETASFLAAEGRRGLRDELGKEESFFVLNQAPGREVNLFLGFDRVKMRPLAESIQPQIGGISESEDAGERDLTRELLDIWRVLIGKMTELCLEGIGQILFPSDPKGSADIQAQVFSESGTDSEISRILKYHFTNANGETRISKVLGREYLFAGIAVINMIWGLKKYVVGKIKSGAGPQFLKRAQELFGSKCLEDKTLDLAYQKAHPLLSFLHRVVVPNNRWVRIPPGTLHAWQGGGNFLIELAHRSDNTFRILDYGREFDHRRRDMHHEESMYALNDNSFFDDLVGERLIFDAQSAQSACHDLLGCSLLVAGTNSSVNLQSEQKSRFLMNPDGDVTIAADGQKGFCRLAVGRCRTVLVEDGMKVEVWPQQHDNRVLHFYKREASDPLMCLSLGGTRWHAGIWEEKYPRTQCCSLAGGQSDIEDLLRAADCQLKQQETRRLDIGLSWPGYGDQATNLHSSLNAVQRWNGKPRDELMRKLRAKRNGNIYILSDFQAALLGEISHPLGRLNAKDPGLLVNIGRGVCVAFYVPDTGNGVFDDERLTLCSAAGRWAYVSLKTGEIRPFSCVPGIPGSLREQVFGPRPNPANGEWVRASKYFSAAGIVARYESDSPKQFPSGLRDFERKDAFELHQELRRVNEPLRVIDLAKDLSGLVQEVERMVEAQSREPHPESGLDVETFGKVRGCFKNIVLTGHVGQFFGIGVVDRRGKDLLTASIESELGTDVRVQRSEIGVIAEREVAGFVYYRGLLDAKAPKKLRT